MILEEMFNGRFYPCETVVADSLRFKQATKASAALMDTLSEHLSKEDYPRWARYGNLPAAPSGEQTSGGCAAAICAQ